LSLAARKLELADSNPDARLPAVSLAPVAHLSKLASRDAQLILVASSSGQQLKTKTTPMPEIASPFRPSAGSWNIVSPAVAIA
jgi:hypothetical protein